MLQTQTRKDRFTLLKKNLSTFWGVYRENTMGIAGLVILLFFT